MPWSYCPTSPQNTLTSYGGAGGKGAGSLSAESAGAAAVQKSVYWGGNYYTTGGTGGTGGVYGSVGGTGGQGSATLSGGTCVMTGPWNGGAAGACTSGNVNITWEVTGTIYGALN